MNTTTSLRIAIFFVAGLMVLQVFSETPTGNNRIIQLPKPRTEGGLPLLNALKHIQTSFSFDKEDFSLQQISDMLWAAYGINKSQAGKRTAPSVMNYQDSEIYLSIKKGVYRWEPQSNILICVLDRDIRTLTGGDHRFASFVAVNIIYVSNFDKLKDIPRNKKEVYAAAHAGFISQNVYLWSSSFGYATVVRGWVDREKLQEVMGLEKNRRVIFTQSVGYPAQHGQRKKNLSDLSAVLEKEGSTTTEN